MKKVYVQRSVNEIPKIKEVNLISHIFFVCIQFKKCLQFFVFNFEFFFEK